MRLQRTLAVVALVGAGVVAAGALIAVLAISGRTGSAAVGGVMRGNYYNAVNDSTTPVYGSLDKKTQRLAWAIGDKKTPVYESGLYNLTLDQSTLLAHFSPERTEQYNLFRLEQPKDEKTGSAP
jgi:hypothetical protein